MSSSNPRLTIMFSIREIAKTLTNATGLPIKATEIPGTIPYTTSPKPPQRPSRGPSTHDAYNTCGDPKDRLMNKSLEKCTNPVNPIAIREEEKRYLPVYYKHDGSRFAIPTTLKLQMSTPYEFFILLKPENSKLTNFKIDHGYVPFYQLDTIRKCNLQFLGVNENYPDNCPVFSIPWTTESYESTKSGDRRTLHLEFEIESMGKYETVLQLKIYPEHNKQHLNWGDPLHYIEYTCISDAGNKTLKCISQNIR